MRRVSDISDAISSALLCPDTGLARPHLPRLFWVIIRGRQDVPEPRFPR
jgi:hypothetical protein